jgi:Ran GTPase-activating protein (RanGAP) involved in mRNA processing and transport
MEEDRRTGIKETTLGKTLRSTFVVPYLEVENMPEEEQTEDIEHFTEEDFQNKNINKRNFIISLFPRKFYAELYFAWCKDSSENITIENAKYFRDELLMRNNKDMRNFNFKSLRVNKNFLFAFTGNLNHTIHKLDLSDNMISDLCMHNIKNVISVKKVVYLNLASNMISAEGLKIIQHELMQSDSLKYLNLGVVDGSFRRNNFSSEGGLVLARILLSNFSLSSLILQDNELNEESAEKIGSSLIQNKTLKKLKISDNKIKNKGAISILENGNKLISLNLSSNEILPEICFDLKKLLETSSNIQEINWDYNSVGLKGIKYIVEGLNKNKSLKYLSLKNTNIGNQGLKILSQGLRNNKILSTLDVSYNTITFESFSDLCDSLNTNAVTCIKMKNNLLGDESMEYFANIILSNLSNSCINYFDFSSCKIYDQGLIYLLSPLAENKKISKIKLRDNYFSHEIDYVVIDFIEKNNNIQYLDLSKNRFSFQAIQKIQKIIDRNIKFQNDKEPNKLLIEMYRLKYENTKLNEMKECLKFLENDVEKVKLNRADLRQDYESFKIKCDEDYDSIKTKNEKLKSLLKVRKEDLKDREENSKNMKETNEKKIEDMKKKIEEMKIREQILKEENEKIKNLTEEVTKEYIVKIEKINNRIDESKKKEQENSKAAKERMEQIIKIDKMIQSKNEGKK